MLIILVALAAVVVVQVVTSSNQDITTNKCSTSYPNGIQTAPPTYLIMSSSSAKICIIYSATASVSESFSGQVLVGTVFANGTQRLSSAPSYDVWASPSDATFSSMGSIVAVTYTITGATGNVYFLPKEFCTLIPISHSSNASPSDLPFFPITCPNFPLTAKIVGLSGITVGSLG
ncbi:MAG: hypothetical protein ACYC9U_02275 [Nitrososphaerales archaeon]